MNYFIFNILAQESSGTQGVLGPTKIYLAVQPPDSVSSVQKTGITASAQTVTKPIESALPSSIPISNNVSEISTQVKTSEQVKY